MPPPAAAEVARLRRLRSLEALDSEPEPVCDQIARLAAGLCGVPIALISLIDDRRQWLMSSYGLAGVAEQPRDIAICDHALRSDSLFEVADAAHDPRFETRPLITAVPGIRFYAGAPLVMPGGERVGTLCVVDHAPRQLRDMQRQALVGLSQIVVTALLQREQRLSEARERLATEGRYRLIVEGQTELISLADEAGILSFVNAAYAQFFGHEPEQMIGRPLADFVMPRDRAGVVEHLRRVLESRGVAEGVNRKLAADGSERWVAWANRCVFVEDGARWCVHSVGRDITKQLAAERALAESERQSRVLYDSTPAMLHSIDVEGRLVAVSDVWLQKMGYRREEVIGRKDLEFQTPESQLRSTAIGLPTLFRDGRIDDFDLQILRRDGTVLDVRLSAVLDRDIDGRPLRSLAVMQDMTEKLAADTAAVQSRHMLQLVFDHLPARISYWDRDSRLRFANQHFLAQFGLAADGAWGRPVQEVVGPGWFARIGGAIETGLRGGRATQFEATTPPDADGRERHVDIRFTPDIRQGEVQGLFVFAIDVSARRLAERELAAQQQRFRLLVDGVRDYAIYMLDAEGRVATWNLGAERIKGYCADEVLGRHFSLFFTPEDVASGKPEAELVQAAREGRYEAEAWRWRSDGSRYWAGVLLTPLRDERGALVGYAKITRDLTERKRQQHLLVRIAELAPCAIVLVDARGRIAMVNAETERAFGYTRNELLGRPVEMLVPAGATPGHEGLREVFVREGDTRKMAGRELRGLRRDGSEFPVEIGLSPIESPDGTNTLAAILDISGRRAQQRETERMLAEKETLLKEVYHRVKNNLQVVQSLLTLQRHALPEGQARAALGDSVQRVRAMALVHEKLYQSGDLAAISLQGYTHDLMRQLAEAHGTAGRGIQMVADVPDLQAGLDSAVPFGLLVSELVSNALKHAFGGRAGGVVRVTVGSQADGDLLTVADDGVGFAAGFDPEVQTRSMGLQLAAGLAQQLGGELACRNDGGAVVSALLTRLRPAAVATEH